MEYTNFTIRARDWDDGRFKVEVTNSPAGRMRQPVAVTYDEARMQPFLDTLLKTSARARMDQQELVRLGKALGAMLLPPEVKEMLMMSLAHIPEDQGLRLLLVLDDPPVARLPWEYLYLHDEDDATSLDGFLALDPRTPIVRHEAYSGGVMRSTAVEGALNVYVGFSSPEDSAPLDLEAERGYIKDGLSEATKDNRRVELRFRDHLQVKHLETECRGAHIFHYAGHGGFYEKTTVAYNIDQKAKAEAAAEADAAGDDQQEGQRGGKNPKREVKDGVGVLFLEDEHHKKELFPAPELANTLRAAGSVRVVVIDACKSARRDANNIWSGIAPLLMRFGIPAAVGMQYSVTDKAALSFARLLYHSLGVGMPLEEAVAHARVAIMNTTPFEAKGNVYEAKWDWGLPVLYLRAESGEIFPALAGDEAAKKEQEEVREGWLSFRQRIEAVEGQAWGVRTQGKVRAASKVAVDQEVALIAEGGVVKGIEAQTAEAGATIDAEQDAGTVQGQLVGGEFMGDL